MVLLGGPKYLATLVCWLQGDVTIWNYLYHNCSLAEGEVPTAGAEFNATLLQDGKPASNVTIDGITMTGTCASGGGRPYYFNASADPIDDNENLLWFHNYTTGLDGRMHGNGANDGIVSTAANDGIKSVMLVDHNTRDSIACCDLIFAGPLNTKWEQNLFGKGENCSDMAGMDHDTVGMDHNMHDGSSHHDKGSNSSAIAGGAATARNSAGVASVGMGAAAAAGAGMAMLFALLL
eukprot:GHRR01013368.1.p1 GENE.GHRR01013368.1~~GHRR01013368.1.p1  ORF type:complete len:235 (+),score=75.30 GHRR01013368.1:621-1325(+)